MPDFKVKTASSGWVYPVDLRTKSASVLYRQSFKLLASDPADNEVFGASAALSSDGNTAIIGDYNEDSSGNTNNGAAYVFTRSGSTWTEQQKLLASGATSDELFGNSVCISADGNIVIVGSIAEDTSPNTNNGAAYVFTRSGSTWTQQQKLLASDAAGGDQFGTSVSISSDGTTAIIGSYAESTSPNTTNGAAYVFTRSGSTWTQQQKLTASDAATNDLFGVSVYISADGTTAIVGSYAEDTSPDTNNGAAYVFTLSAGTWTQQQKLLASDPATQDLFGHKVVLSSDGNTALIGAYQEGTSPNTDNGAAYVFTRSGSTWTQQQKLLASDAADTDYFGYSVALSLDGNTALIGAVQEDTSPNTYNGAAYVFTRSGSTWTQQQKLLASDAAGADNFGYSVALSSDGNTALIGAYQEDTSPNTTNGAAYIFELTDWSYVSAISVNNGGTWYVGYSPPPGAPTLTVSTVTNASGTTKTLSWTRPSSFFSITGYVVESSTDGIFWTDLGHTGITRSAIASFVPAGTVSSAFLKYYRVAAETQYITGTYSNILNF